MGICHLLGAGLLYLMATITKPDQFALLFVITFTYSLLYNPTLAVVNSLTFRNVPDGQRDFPGLRVLGTIGWICAGVILDRVFSGKTQNAAGEMIPDTIATNGPLLQAAILSLILSVFVRTIHNVGLWRK